MSATHGFWPAGALGNQVSNCDLYVPALATIELGSPAVASNTRHTRTLSVEMDEL